mgnify:CR=1 FL=1
MEILKPDRAEGLAEALAAAAAAGRQVRLCGASSKDAMGGPLAPAGLAISTAALNRVRLYDPRDLTISVEAGMTYRELRRLLAANGQMLPLDPPFAETATTGGVVASNSSGPRRRLYGTARDMVIGMTFATLEGKLVESGGMVVKNAAGFDMAKLMIGSFGTLAAIAVVNFRVFPRPAASRTFVFSTGGAGEALAVRDRILKSVLQPAAADLLNPAAAEALGRQGWLLAVRAAGNEAVIARWSRELSGAEPLDGDAEEEWWRCISEFAPEFLARTPQGAVARVSTTLSGLARVVEQASGPLLARAASGVCYAGFGDPGEAAAWAARAAAEGSKAVVEYAPPAAKEKLEMWPAPGSDFESMRRIKEMFDPRRLLNPGRLYGRL